MFSADDRKCHANTDRILYRSDARTFLLRIRGNAGHWKGRIVVQGSFETASGEMCGNGQVDWRLINDHQLWMLLSLHMIMVFNARWGKLRFVTLRTMYDNSSGSGTKEGSRLTGSCTTFGWNGWKRDLCVYRTRPYSNILLWSSLCTLCLNSFCAYE